MLNTLMTIKLKNKEEELRYAYAFMKTEKLNIKECAFANPNATKVDKRYIFPQDIFHATFVKENLPSWKTFKSNELSISSPGFSCVGCVDTKDEKRVVFNTIEGIASYNCYGDYEGEARKAFEDIVLIYSSLK